MEEAAEAVEIFKSLAEVNELSVTSYRIDNVTCSGHYAIDMPLEDIARGLHRVIDAQKDDADACPQYRPLFFGAIHIKFPKRGEQEEEFEKKFGFGGTVSLFHTGKYSIVGVTNSERANYVFNKVLVLLDEIHRFEGKTLFAPGNQTYHVSP